MFRGSLELSGNQLTGPVPVELVSLDDLRVLDLSSNQLTGPIPAELGSLANLRELYLSQNQLTGNTPPELGSLSNLQWLSLGANRLAGKIPSELGNLANLRSLVLSENRLEEEIPSELGDLANLEELFLSHNQLTGEIPTELGNLANLQSLYLSGNQLTGCIPARLRDVPDNDLASLSLPFCEASQDACVTEGAVTDATNTGLVSDYETLLEARDTLAGSGSLNWSEDTSIIEWDGITVGGTPQRVTELYLSRNQLTGEIPSELGGLSKLMTLNLRDNQLTGSIPAQLGNLTNLETLYLSRNQLTGEIPSELGGLSKLTILDFSGNQLTGPIPPELGRLANLERLYLIGNELTGSIPSELSGLSKLTILDFSDNSLTGPIPAWLGSLTNLETLSLWRNQLTGPIPSELGRLTNLQDLSLGDNRLTGSIPARLGNLTNLETLYLSRNQLTSSIPKELGGLTNLVYFVLWNNQLSGSIPKELGDLTNLVELNFQKNQLSGSIPKELGSLANLVRLDLGFNQLTGPIPKQLSSLANLEDLNLGSNQLIGPVPTELSSLSSLEGLYLGRNRLTGSMPSELGSLTRLKYLNLGSNQLSGPIPQELGRLVNLEGLWLSANQLSEEIPAELGSLTNLQALDLSYNQLTGPIPVWLGYLSNLHRLELSSNQLAGPIPPELGYLSYLTRLYLSENQLTGCIPAGLRHVTNNDLDQLGLPFCDVSPQRGGELRLAVPYDLFDGRFSPFDEQRKREAAQFNTLIFSRLMRSSASGVVPDLAVSWEANDDGTEWIVNLRQDASFHDGRPVAAADVLYSIEAMNARFNTLPHLANLELIDDVTLRVDFAEPSWDFPLRMTRASSVIVPEGMLEAGVDDFTQLVGSGPFRPVDYRVGELLTLERNPDYYETGLPHLDGIRIFVIPDRATRAAAFRVGELDYLGYPYGGLPVLTVDEADRASEARPDVVFAPYPIVLALWFDTQSAPFNDRRVRVAVLRAIDDAALMQSSELGKGEPQSSIPRAIFPTWTTFLDDPSAVEEWRRHDPDMSRALLAEAGYPDGFDTVMRIPEDFPSYWDSVAVVVSEMLKRVDISVALERVPSSEHRTAPADRGIKLMEVLPFDGNAEAFLIEHFTAGGTFNYSRTDIVIPDLDPDRPDSIIPVQQYLAEEVFYIPLPAPMYARSGSVRGPLLEGSSVSDLGTALSRVWLDLSASASCATGGAVSDATNAGLVSDCEALLAAKDVLTVSAPLNWSADTPMAQWEGVTLRGATPRVGWLDLRAIGG